MRKKNITLQKHTSNYSTILQKHLICSRFMEIVLIEKKTFDAMLNKIAHLAQQVETLSKCKDLGLKKWMTSKEIADLLGISLRTLQTYRDKGMIPYTQIGNKLYYNPNEVRQIMNNLIK